jgi:hypothetical protein
MGYLWVAPLSKAPTSEWCARFDAVDWPALSAELGPPYLPRLDGAQIWLPAIRTAALKRTLELIADQVERLNEVRDSCEYRADDRQRDSVQGRKRQDGAAVIEAWWAERLTRCGR